MRIDKLLDGMRANPKCVRFEDLVRVLEYHGVSVRHGKGSHVVAQRAGRIYTIRRPAAGAHVHPKSVKHCLEMFGLWE